jgi:hypothetical protein
LHGQVAQLYRPLPPGVGWGEGPVKSTSALATSLIVVSVERIEVVLLSDATSAHNHVRDVLSRSIRVADDLLIRRSRSHRQTFASAVVRFSRRQGARPTAQGRLSCIWKRQPNWIIFDSSSPSPRPSPGGRTSHGLRPTVVNEDKQVQPNGTESDDNARRRVGQPRPATVSALQHFSPFSPASAGRRCRRRMRGLSVQKRPVPPHRAVPTTSPT